MSFPDFALVTAVHFNDVNEANVTFSLALDLTTFHNGTWLADTTMTAETLPSLTNANAAIVTAAVAYFLAQWGTVLPRASVAYQPLAQGS